MARKTFFSFHYKPDVSRAHVVRNSWMTKPDRKSAGFFDSSVFESKKKANSDALKTFLTAELKGASVTCVLFGAETYKRQWVRYELVKSFRLGMGLLAVQIDGIKDLKGKTSKHGPNPFSYLGYIVKNRRVYWKVKSGSNWLDYTDVTSVAVSAIPYNVVADNRIHTFSTLFLKYKWNGDKGYDNLGKWIETAAKNAGR